MSLSALRTALRFLFIGAFLHNSYAQAPTAGVVVEAPATANSAAPAGLVPGDHILSWSSANRRGDFHSPADWLEFEMEQAPRGPAILYGRRNGQATTWPYSESTTAVTVRPFLDASLQSVWQKSIELEKSGNLIEAAANWRALIAVAPAVHHPALLLRLGGSLAAAKQFEQAIAAFDLADTQAKIQSPGSAPHLMLASARLLVNAGNASVAEVRYRRALDGFRLLNPNGLAVAASLNGLGRVAYLKRESKRANEFFTQALDIVTELAPGSLTMARILYNLGTASSQQADWNAAEKFQWQSFAIRQKLAPATPDLANSLNELGNVAFMRGDLDQAESNYLRAVAIQESLLPNSPDLAASLNNLGAIAKEKGDLAAAESRLLQALAIRRRLDPASLDTGASLNNLGILARLRGNLQLAEDYYQQSLTIKQKLAPGSLLEASALNSLSVVAIHRGDLVSAINLQSKALPIFERLAPNSLYMAGSLSTLGGFASERGDLDAAANYFLRALAIRRKLAADSLDVSHSLTDLADLAQKRGDWNAAADYHQQALQLRQKLAPFGLDTAASIYRLAALSERKGDRTQAARLYSQALEIQRKVAPGSLDEAITLHELGVLRMADGQIETAKQSFSQSLAALESRTAQLGGTRATQADFRAKYFPIYRHYEEILLRSGNDALAFQVAEQARARSLLQLLAERDLLFSSEVPSALLSSRNRNASAYELAQAQLAKLNPSNSQSKIDILVAQLRSLSAERDQIAERMRLASPRLAAIQYPQPLDLPATHAALDPGTALLSFSVGEKQTILYVVLPSGLSTFTFPIQESELGTRIETFRRLISDNNPAAVSELHQAARQLYDLLLRPAESLLAPAARLLILPDGPLQVLPFAALRRNEKQFLIEWKPLHTAPSTTVFAELKKQRRPRPAGAQLLAAFGDPHLGRSAAASASLQRMLIHEPAGAQPAPIQALPFARKEVQSLAALFPTASRVFLGENATEERVKSIGRDVRYLHFATHGVLNEKFPLDSSIVLTLPDSPSPGAENGLLQAWEIFDQLRIDADLVTLSACNSGRGRQLSGEGLIGLTRAFQYAGARSVLASLWSVDDRRTMELMESFYTSLRSGVPKDEALRRAQISLIKSSSGSNPFYWAAFVLSGDWR